jgi:hypothetical protein
MRHRRFPATLVTGIVIGKRLSVVTFFGDVDFQPGMDKLLISKES